MTKLKQALSVASNNPKGAIRVPPSMPGNETVQKIGNVTPREEFSFNENEAGGADFRHLHEEVAVLLKNGHLREFLSDRAKSNYGKNRDVRELAKPVTGSPRLTINMIFGGDKVNGVTFSAVKKTKISVTHGRRIREASEDDEITFTKENANGLLLPHNDALVISLNVLGLKIKRVLVDPGSSANNIQWRYLEQSKLTKNIVPAIMLLAKFNLTSVMTRGEILLPIHAEGVKKTTLFEVVDGDMGYNVVLGRPWIHEMKVVPSTYHQLLMFPTPKGVIRLKIETTRANALFYPD
ncbi:uncharacterized protein LOC142177176 [Nicotiana tabacum]|uniref:Uncharacterized protein LOC142177176 n=1 Tax=Nicotiana tabacum TaxID=4097 RepID=A0AC58TWY5_TOBAC